MREAAINAGLVQKTNIADHNWADRLHIITYVVFRPPESKDFFSANSQQYTELLRDNAFTAYRTYCVRQRARSRSSALRTSYESPPTETEPELHDL